MRDFGFWILDFGLGLAHIRTRHASGGRRYPALACGVRVAAPIQNPNSKIQNPMGGGHCGPALACGVRVAAPIQNPNSKIQNPMGGGH